jgi:hypothetical protein
MVTMTKDSFSIEVKTGGCSPHENYVDTMHGIINVMQCQDEDMLDKNFQLLELLKEMLPTLEQAKAMFDEIKSLP